MATSLAFSCLSLCTNDIVDKERRASLNGFVMSMGSLAKTLGPFSGSIVFAWSINNGLSFPLDFHFVFLMIGILAVGAAALPLLPPATSTSASTTTATSITTADYTAVSTSDFSSHGSVCRIEASDLSTNFEISSSRNSKNDTNSVDSSNFRYVDPTSPTSHDSVKRSRYRAEEVILY